MLRFIAGPTVATAGAANVEVKPVDGTANPYLAVGGMLTAGLDGIEQGLRLPPSTEEDPASLAPEILEERGVRQLPASLAEATEQLAASSVLRGAMGEFLFETYLATRRGEAEQYAGLEDDELIRKTRWRF